jgi:hypothetical protein
MHMRDAKRRTERTAPGRLIVRLNPDSPIVSPLPIRPFIILRMHGCCVRGGQSFRPIVRRGRVWGFANSTRLNRSLGASVVILGLDLGQRNVDEMHMIRDYAGVEFRTLILPHHTIGIIRHKLNPQEVCYISSRKHHKIENNSRFDASR